MRGPIVLLNGASSAGKSTLAAALQARLPLPFWHYSIDHLLAAHILPQARTDSGEFPWSGQRGAFFDGFHHSLAAFAGAGNALIVEHIVDTEAWLRQLLALLEGFDVFFVALHCPLPELERRAAARGAHKLAEARADFASCHRGCRYDHECSSLDPVDAVADAVARAWTARVPPGAFAAMRAERGMGG